MFAPRTRTWLAIGVLVSAAFYRTLSFWAVNAWDLSSPTKILLVAMGLAVIGIGLWFLIAGTEGTKIPVALGLGALAFLLMSWERVSVPIAVALALLLLAFIWIGRKASASALLDGTAVVALVAIGVMPVAQLVMAHVTGAEAYPVVSLQEPLSATTSGEVEDVLVVIVDSYPNLTLAKDWFDHDTIPLIDGLEGHGFSVEPNAWSHHTFTSVSVPSILALQSVIEAGPIGSWENRSSLFRMTRGDNLVSRTLESAGFRYTHVESGWDGTECGHTVDRCVASPWIDDQVTLLLNPTVLGGWVQNRHPFYTGTLNAARALRKQVATLSSDGAHDYIFAHFLMPHDPLLADAECAQTDHPGDLDQDKARRFAAISAQMTCVDTLLTTALEGLGPDTAVLLAGDHGTATGEQAYRPAEEWSDADIAERFGVLLAYRLPAGCAGPSSPDPMVAMGAILTCALEEDFSPPPSEHLIGYENPVAVDAERLTRIKQLVGSGQLLPDPD
jgi:Sulfatase